MVQLFQAFFAQNYSISAGFLNSTNPYPSLPPFEAPTWAVRVNVLWFSSLIISIASASFGMLVKQWLREYLRMTYTSPQERLRARQFRYKALDNWKVFEIAATLPLMLEVSVLLFFIGLCYFTLAVHWSIGRATIPLVCGWAFLFIAATIAPVFSPRCPYRTTLLNSAMLRARKLAYISAKSFLHLYHATSPILRLVFKALGIINDIAKGLVSAIFQFVRRLAERAREHLASSNLVEALRKRIELPLGPLQQLQAHMKEEADFLGTGVDEMELLKSIIDIVPGDGILRTLFDMLRRQGPSLADVTGFVDQVINHRIGEWRNDLVRTELLSKLARDAFLEILVVMVDFHLDTSALPPPKIPPSVSDMFVPLVLTGDVRLSVSQTRIYNLILEQWNSSQSSESERISYAALQEYAESSLDGLEDFLTDDGELKAVARNCLDICLIPWAAKSFDSDFPFSPRLLHRFSGQLTQAHFYATRSDNAGDILRRSEPHFKQILCRAICVASTSFLPCTEADRGRPCLSLPVTLAIRMAVTQSMPEVSRLLASVPKGRLPHLSRPVVIPSPPLYEASFARSSEGSLSYGIRGALVAYQFTVTLQNYEGSSIETRSTW